MTLRLDEISRAVTGRPWVEIKNPTLADVKIDEKGLDVRVTLPLQNTSEIPAIAAVDSKMIFITEQLPKQTIVKEQDGLCDGLKQKMLTDAVSTTTLFRGRESFPTTYGLHASTDDLNKAAQPWGITTYPETPSKMVLPEVISCVVYKATSGSEIYRTAHANTIMWTYCDKDMKNCGLGDLPLRLGTFDPRLVMFVPFFDPAVWPE